MKQIPVLEILPGEDLADREYCIKIIRGIIEDAIINQEPYEINEHMLTDFLIDQNDYEEAKLNYQKTKDESIAVDFAKEKILTSTLREVGEKDYNEAVKEYKQKLKIINK